MTSTRTTEERSSRTSDRRLRMSIYMKAENGAAHLSLLTYSFPVAFFAQQLKQSLSCSFVARVELASLPKRTPSYTRLSSLGAHVSLPA